MICSLDLRLLKKVRITLLLLETTQEERKGGLQQWYEVNDSSKWSFVNIALSTVIV